MKTYSFVIIIIFGIILEANCKQNSGARLTGMGVNSVAVLDDWNVNDNPAAIMERTVPVIAISHCQYVTSTQLSQQGAVFILPVRKNYLSIGCLRYGMQEFNEINSNFSVARSFGHRLRIAIKGNINQLKIANYGSAISYAVDLGIFYQLTSQVGIGAVFKNISFEEYETYRSTLQVPTVLSVGFAYKASDKVLFSLTGTKEYLGTFNTSVGLEYRLIQAFSLRSGWSINPLKQFGGFGFRYQNVDLDLAFQHLNSLGITPQISLSYAL